MHNIVVNDRTVAKYTYLRAIPHKQRLRKTVLQDGSRWGRRFIRVRYEWLVPVGVVYHTPTMTIMNTITLNAYKKAQDAVQHAVDTGLFGLDLCGREPGFVPINRTYPIISS